MGIGLLLASVVIIYTCCRTSTLNGYHWTVYLKRTVCSYRLFIFVKQFLLRLATLVFRRPGAPTADSTDIKG